MTAMASLDFGNIEEHKLRVGAAVGNYSNSRAIAIGVAMKPTTDIIVNAKYSVSTEDIKTSAMGAGITYDFDI